MEDIILIDYLKKKGILNDHEYNELSSKLHEPYMSYEHCQDKCENHDKAEEYSEFFNNFKKVTENMNETEKHKFVDTLKDYGKTVNDHFNESYAKYLVSNMYHCENGRKYIGEKFNTDKAREVCERYKGLIPESVTYADIYVAINAQYHDYCELFKSWFGDSIDHKIIESAIVFWFKDEDYHNGFKLWNYFK